MTHQPSGITRWERSTGQLVNKELHRSKNQSSRPGSLHPQQDHLAAGEEAPASQMHHHKHHHHHNNLEHQQNQNQPQGNSGHASTQSDQKKQKAGLVQKTGGPIKRSQNQHKQQKQHPKLDDEDEDENSEADSDVLDPNLNVYDNVQYN